MSQTTQGRSIGKNGDVLLVVNNAILHQVNNADYAGWTALHEACSVSI